MTFLYVKDDTGGDPITLQAAAALVPPNALPVLDPVRFPSMVPAGIRASHAQISARGQERHEASAGIIG